MSLSEAALFKPATFIIRGPFLKVRGPFVQTLCIEKESYMDAI